MEFAYVSVPAAPVRKKPAHNKEMVNQLLFGEAVKVLSERDDLWVRVQSLHDLYEGWTTRNMLTIISEADAFAKIGHATQEVFSRMMLNNLPLFVTAGASLPAWYDGKGKIGDLLYEFTGEVIQKDSQVPSGALVTSLSTAWLNAPYLWGGRTILGTDCSGFVQVIYKMMGIDLARDASQQVMEGKAVSKFRERQPGDLAFFGKKGAITHVGIILEDSKIIHASGKVRIDQLDKKGITSEINEDLTTKAGDETDFQALLQNDRTLDYLEESLKLLNDEQQQCVTLFYLQKMSYQEISDRTGFTPLQVKSYIQNGKRNLKILVEKKIIEEKIRDRSAGKL